MSKIISWLLKKIDDIHYGTIDKIFLRNRPPEKYIDILHTYLRDLPRSLGIAIIASVIVLFSIETRFEKLKLAALFIFGIVFIWYSMHWDLDLTTEKELKGYKDKLKRIVDLSKLGK